jgi:PAS domain S-box-containing protein
VYGLLQDADESLWVATAGLIFRQDASKTILRFDHTHGVQVGDLNLNADVNLKPDILLFGGNEGINVVRPGLVKTNSRAPPIQMTSLLLNNKEKKLLVSGELQLEYGINGLSVEVAALDYTFPQKNRYKYKLEGYDDQWVDNGTNRNITYTNLDPGSYVLRVQGSNSDGVWNEDGLSIPITIDPPLWATWWAYSAYIALALFSFYQLMMIGSRRIGREAEERFNRRLRRYVESLDDTSECVLNANRQGSVMFSNNAVASVFGKRPSEVGGYPLFEILFQQVDQRDEAKEYVDSGKNFQEEVPYQMSDGTEKILEISVSPALETAEDDVAYVSIVRDVTERSLEQAELRVSRDQLATELKNLHIQLENALVQNADQRSRFSTALAEKDVLLREIHDRVYDNLATLTSLLSIQSGKYSDPKILNILDDNQRRISAVALVHERLYQSREVRQVAMAEYVDLLLSSLYRKLVPEELEIAMVKELGEFDLAIDLAVPCGLIINELFSNALIHGFAGRQHGSGTVEVKLYLLANECVVFVSDSGRGLPEDINTQSASMGFEIVSILVEQLEGTFRLIGGQGTTFEVRFPV